MKSKVFNSYNSIELTTSKRFVNGCIDYIDKNMKYVITEKIDGSNIGICINLKDHSIYFISRNEFIEDEHNNFYTPMHSYIDRIKLNIDALINNAKELLGPTFDKYYTMIIYGEIFGGKYDEPSVKINPNALKVQKRINYTPNNEFLAFDIAFLRDKTDDELRQYNERIQSWQEELAICKDDKRIDIVRNNIKMMEDRKVKPFCLYVDYEDFIKLLENSNIKSVPVLAIVDSLTKALSYPEEFDSVIYKLYNLPKIEGNQGEGIVIKPIKNQYIFDNQRVILKKKNIKYSENGRANNRLMKEKLNNQYSDSLKELIEKTNDYINQNRLDNVLSKISKQLDSKDFGMIMKMLSQDVIKDLEKDNPELFEIVKNNNEEYKSFTKELSKLCTAFLKPIFRDLLDEQKGE